MTKGMYMFSKIRAIALAVVTAGVLTFTAAQASAFAATASTAKPAHPARTAQTSQITPTPISGVVTDAAGNVVQTFSGTFTPTSFQGTKTTLTALGTVTGTLTNVATNATTTVNQTPGSSVVTPADPTCNVLSLTLGPLHLDLLGLVVDLNQVVLNITAVSGAGNLLGNLLCAVANLLNNSGSGNMIPVANLLNQILSLL
ncbi:MAG: hypothetical protein J2P43_04235 [Candidatus Dormibacteraeota bacterium]|nr:hypothetical protein [Candidatus Dormibacteraeota bacterium]